MIYQGAVAEPTPTRRAAPIRIRQAAAIPKTPGRRYSRCAVASPTARDWAAVAWERPGHRRSRDVGAPHTAKTSCHPPSLCHHAPRSVQQKHRGRKQRHGISAHQRPRAPVFPSPSPWQLLLRAHLGPASPPPPPPLPPQTSQGEAAASLALLVPAAAPQDGQGGYAATLVVAAAAATPARVAVASQERQGGRLRLCLRRGGQAEEMPPRHLRALSPPVRAARLPPPIPRRSSLVTSPNSCLRGALIPAAIPWLLSRPAARPWRHTSVAVHAGRKSLRPSNGVVRCGGPAPPSPPLVRGDILQRPSVRGADSRGVPWTLPLPTVRPRRQTPAVGCAGR